MAALKKIGWLSCLALVAALAMPVMAQVGGGLAQVRRLQQVDSVLAAQVARLAAEVGVAAEVVASIWPPSRWIWD